MQTLKRFTLDTKLNGNGGLKEIDFRAPTPKHYHHVVVTPQIAREWLESKNTANRPANLGKAREYQQDFLTQRWKYNGDTIRFDRNGVLLDGQTRLQACVLAGVPFVTDVIVGLDPDVFDTIDRGRKRSFAHNLSVRGFKNTLVLGAAIAHLWRYENGTHSGSRGSNPSNGALWDTFERHPGIEASVNTASRAKNVAPAAMLIFLHYVFSQKNAPLADRFIEKLADGTDLPKSSPIYQLRERFLGRNRDNIRHPEDMALTIKAWNYLRANKPCRGLYWREAEDFPEIK